jgi:uncharacterized protein YbcI
MPPAPPPRPVRAPKPAARAPEFLEEEDDDGPITSRSRAASTTARAALDQILVEIQGLLAQVRKDDEATFGDKASAIRAALQAARLLAGLTGELGASETTIATSPHYRRVRAAIVDELRAFPAAAKAVVERLEREEGSSSEAAA